MDALLRDIRYAIRTLVRSPGFTVVAVVTLALGIGANTAIFSVVDSVLLSDLPYEEPDELVTVWLDHTRRDGPEREWFTPGDFVDYRAEPNLFEELGAWGGFNPTLTGAGDPQVLTAASVTEGMLERVLGVRPILGRGFNVEDDTPSAPGTVVLSYAFWQQQFGGDRSALGRSISLNEVPFVVIGVMPEGFEPPFVPKAQVWTPIQLDPNQCGYGCYNIRTVARLAPGVGLEQARARASAVAARLEEAYPIQNGKVGVAIFGLQEDLVRPAERALWVLLGAVGFVLLIACTNVANLLLARGASRESEFALRVALGARRGPILRQLLTESVLLAAVGGALGLALASWGTETLLVLAPPLQMPNLDIAMDGRVLGFTALIALGTGVLFGLVPALRAGRSDIYSGVRSTSKLARSLRGALVVSQVGMALVLLVGAGLLIRSFERLSSAELGFDPEGVLAVTLAIPNARYSDDSQQITFYQTLLGRMAAIPGVSSVGATNSIPLAGADGDADFRVEGAPPRDPTDPAVAWIRRVTKDYFRTIDLTVIEGRSFEDSDDADAPRVVIINETLAERYFDYPTQNPVGQRVAFGNPNNPTPTWRTVVGVAEDTRHFGIRDGTRPAMYFPYQQVPVTFMTAVLRTGGEPLDLADDVRTTIASVDPALAASSIQPLEQLVNQALSVDRFLTSLLGAFAFLALVLAAVGLYGVISYGVTQRMREMGIRLALGAGTGDVRQLVVKGGLGLTLGGVALGVVASIWLTGVLDTLVYDVEVTDPVTFLTMVGVLTGVALLASWLPARRASNTDPVSVMREE